MIDRLLDFSTPRKETYSFFYELVEAFQDKESDSVFSLLAEVIETLNSDFRTSKHSNSLEVAYRVQL